MSSAYGSVISFACVGLSYGRSQALDNVSLEIPTGRMVGLIGPDGVGKSSLLALAAGARVIQNGTVNVLGGSMADRRHRHRCYPRIAYMPQGLGSAGVDPSQLYGWRRKALSSGAVAPLTGATGSEVRFARVEPVASPVVEIVIGDILVRAGGDVSPEHLAKVLRAVRLT